MDSWEQLQADPQYQKASYEDRIATANNFFKANIASDPRFLDPKTPDTDREETYRNFISTVKAPSDIVKSFTGGLMRGQAGQVAEAFGAKTNWNPPPAADFANTAAENIGTFVGDLGAMGVGAIAGIPGAPIGLPIVGAFAAPAAIRASRQGAASGQSIMPTFSKTKIDKVSGKPEIESMGSLYDITSEIESAGSMGFLTAGGGALASKLIAPWARPVGELAGMQTAGVIESGKLWTGEEFAINLALLGAMRLAKTPSDLIKRITQNNLDKLAQTQVRSAVDSANKGQGITADINAKGQAPVNVIENIVGRYNDVSNGGEKAKLAAIQEAEEQLIAQLYITRPEFKEYSAKFPRKVPIAEVAKRFLNGEPAPKGKEALPQIDVSSQKTEVLQAIVKNPKGYEKLLPAAKQELQRRIDSGGKEAVAQTAETLTETKASAKNVLPPVTEVGTKPNRAADKFAKLIEDTGTPESAVSTRINSNLKKIGLTGTQVDAGTGMLDINITNKEGKPAGILTLAVTDKGIEILSIDNQNVKGNHITDNVFKTLSDVSKETGLPVTGTFTNPISEAAYKKHFPKAEQKGMSYAELETVKAKQEATNGLQKEGKEKTQVEPILAKPTFKEYVESKGVEMPKAGTPEHKALLAEFNAEPVEIKVAKEYNPEAFKPNHMVETINLEADFKHTKRVIPAKEAVLELKQNRDILTALKAFRDCLGA